MPIVARINSHYDLYEEFKLYNRHEQFSHEGFTALFDYLAQYSEDTGEPYVLDVVGICCEWTEEHYKDIAQSYRIDLSDCADEEEAIEAVEDYLSDNTQYISLSEGKFLYVTF
jgi:predicted ArsR family transcriptional regulator